jgi:hypothetical protein
MDVELVELELAPVDLAEGKADAPFAGKGLVQPFVGVFQIVVEAFVAVALFEHEVDLRLGDDARVGGLPDLACQSGNGGNVRRRHRPDDDVRQIHFG